MLRKNKSYRFADKSFGAICSPLQVKSNYYLLLITYYLKIETPQSLGASSPKSGAIWLAFNYSFIQKRAINNRPYNKLYLLPLTSPSSLHKSKYKLNYSFKEEVVNCNKCNKESQNTNYIKNFIYFRHRFIKPNSL